MVKAPEPVIVKEFSCRFVPREMQLLAMSALASMTGGNSVKLFWIELVLGTLMLIVPETPNSELAVISLFSVGFGRASIPKIPCELISTFPPRP